MDKENLFFEEAFAEIEKELENIDKLTEELKESASLASRRIKGSILHDFYNCCERVFRRIAVDINGGFSESHHWRKELLYRMTIPVKEIRPRLISGKLAAELDDYLSFRHVFRNIYGFELEGERLDRLVEKFGWVSEMFKKETREFLREIQTQED